MLPVIITIEFECPECEKVVRIGADALCAHTPTTNVWDMYHTVECPDCRKEFKTC